MFRSAFEPKTTERIVLVTGLLVFWFPLQLYTEWYIGMYSLVTMKGYYTFIFLGIVAVAAYGFCIFILAKSLSVKLFSAMGAGLLGLMGIIGKVKPSWLGMVAYGIEDMPFQWFLASLSILILALGAMVFSFVVDPVALATAGRRGRKR